MKLFMLDSLKQKLPDNLRARGQYERHLYCNILCGDRWHFESVGFSEWLL